MYSWVLKSKTEKTSTVFFFFVFFFVYCKDECKQCLRHVAVFLTLKCVVLFVFSIFIPSAARVRHKQGRGANWGFMQMSVCWWFGGKAAVPLG